MVDMKRLSYSIYRNQIVRSRVNLFPNLFVKIKGFLFTRWGAFETVPGLLVGSGKPIRDRDINRPLFFWEIHAYLVTGVESVRGGVSGRIGGVRTEARGHLVAGCLPGRL